MQAGVSTIKYTQTQKKLYYNQLKKVLFAQPGVGVIELQGEFNLLDVAEYTQIA